MRRKPHWTALVAYLSLLWCAAVLLDHYWASDTWAHSLRTGLTEIPIWASLALGARWRKKRRDKAAAASG
jgi:hypothetical protein